MTLSPRCGCAVAHVSVLLCASARKAYDHVAGYNLFNVHARCVGLTMRETGLLSTQLAWRTRAWIRTSTPLGHQQQGCSFGFQPAALPLPSCGLPDLSGALRRTRIQSPKNVRAHEVVAASFLHLRIVFQYACSPSRQTLRP